jgi:hypothetical protein
MEIWKPVVDFPEYFVSNLGNIKRNNKLLKSYPNNRGYLTVSLSKDGIVKSYLLHRLVGIAFLPNPENKPTIDHYPDKTVTNNNINNLKWATDDEQLETKTYPETINGRLGITNQKYITVIKNKFRVYNRRGNNKFFKLCDTLEEAVIARDAFISQT